VRNDDGKERERRQFKCKWIFPGAIDNGGFYDQGACRRGGCGRGCCAACCLCHYQLLTQDMHISPTAFGFWWLGGVPNHAQTVQNAHLHFNHNVLFFEQTHEHMLQGLDAKLETQTGFWFTLLQICPKESQVSRILIESTSRHNAHHHLPQTIDCPSPWILSIWKTPVSQPSS
jgi:hypothetical protein